LHFELNSTIISHSLHDTPSDLELQLSIVMMDHCHHASVQLVIRF